MHNENLNVRQVKERRWGVKWEPLYWGLLLANINHVIVLADQIARFSWKYQLPYLESIQFLGI